MYSTGISMETSGIHSPRKGGPHRDDQENREYGGQAEFNFIFSCAAPGDRGPEVFFYDFQELFFALDLLYLRVLGRRNGSSFLRDHKDQRVRSFRQA